MSALCLRCGEPFKLRLTGGSAQRFCCDACRAAFHAAARLWALAEIEGGRLTVDQLKNTVRHSVHAAPDSQVGSEAIPVAPPETRTRRKKGGEDN